MNDNETPRIPQVLLDMETSARERREAENERLAQIAQENEARRKRSVALFRRVATLFVAETIDEHARKYHKLDGFCLDPEALEPFVHTSGTLMPDRANSTYIGLDLPRHTPILLRVKWDKPDNTGHVSIQPNSSNNWIEVETGGANWNDIGDALDIARCRWEWSHQIWTYPMTGEVEDGNEITYAEMCAAIHDAWPDRPGAADYEIARVLDGDEDVTVAGQTYALLE